MSVVGNTELDGETLVAQELSRRARIGQHPQQGNMFQFGKYRNESYEDVTEESRDDNFWGSQERMSSKYLQHNLVWVPPQHSTLMCKVSGLIPEATSLPSRSQNQTGRSSKLCTKKGWKQSEKCVPRCDPRHAPRFKLQCDACSHHVFAVRHSIPGATRRPSGNIARNVPAQEHGCQRQFVGHASSPLQRLSPARP